MALNDEGQSLIDQLNDRIKRRDASGSVTISRVALELIECYEQKDVARIRTIRDLGMTIRQIKEEQGNASKTTYEELVELIQGNLDYASRLADAYVATQSQPIAVVSHKPKKVSVVVDGVRVMQFTKRDPLPGRWGEAYDALTLPDTVVGPVREFYRNAINYHPPNPLA